MLLISTTTRKKGVVSRESISLPSQPVKTVWETISNWTKRCLSWMLGRNSSLKEQ